MKRTLSILLAALLLFSAAPISAVPQETAARGITTGNVEIDDDPTGGYTGDYVVIYNPGTSSYSSLSTGNMSGRIVTQLGGVSAPVEAEVSDRPYVIDVDGRLAEEAKAMEPVPERDMEAEGLSFNVGDTHNFTLYSSYCPLPNNSVQFKVLAKGDHCYIWTPTSTASNVYPLDSIDPSFAQICADEFDSKFELMQSSFGNHSNGSQGDGRLNMLYYNIDDGWTPGNGYVAGFFYSYDLSSNGMPILNIDTYPGVHYVTTSGEEINSVTGTFNTMVHEYQHLINYSVTGGSDTWINECMSAAAEEICYPGSSVVSRIQSWINYRYATNDDWLDPPEEHEYVSSWDLHNGFSMYDWSNYIEMDDLLCLYAQVSLFAQYIFTQYGNTTFRQILTRLASGSDFVQAFPAVTGQSASEFVGNFRIAVTANASPDLLEGLYGFVPQEGYDPSMYHDVQNPYSLLTPVVFTGNSCNIYGGGAICIKPVGGVYEPPTGAASGLKYYGITLSNIPPEPVALTSISLTPASAAIYAGTTVNLSALKEPENANNYELTWSSSAPSVATVTGGTRSATVTGVSSGVATITCRAHDLLNDRYYTATSTITVRNAPTLNDALNVANGTLNFTSTGSYPWIVDMENTSPHLAAKSGNATYANSESTLTITVTMNAGDTMSFDWKVESEANYDKLHFYVNSSEITNISGSTSWATMTYTAPSTGSYTFKWTYTKDNSVNSGADTGWVDNVSVPGYTASWIPGDVDMNGVVEAADALLALRNAMHMIALSDLQIEIGDMDGDGVVTAADALVILRIAMGID